VSESAYVGGPSLSGVAFQMGPDQRAASVVENLNVFGQGTFTRVPDRY
jgi:hypothetical protein